jgi:Lrp/AsnC ligand binding domain
MSMATGSPVRAVVRVRLAPCLPWQAFEQWLRAIPSVPHAVLVTGDDDYEVQVNCPTFADLGDALTQICGCAGVQVTSTALILHEVPGLGLGQQAIADEVTMRRLGTM